MNNKKLRRRRSSKKDGEHDSKKSGVTSSGSGSYNGATVEPSSSSHDPNKLAFNPKDVKKVLQRKSDPMEGTSSQRPSSMLCDSCSVKVSGYFDNLINIMKNSKAELLGLNVDHVYGHPNTQVSNRPQDVPASKSTKELNVCEDEAAEVLPGHASAPSSVPHNANNYEKSHQHVNIGSNTAIQPDHEKNHQHMYTGSNTVILPDHEKNHQHMYTGSNTVILPDHEKNHQHMNMGSNTVVLPDHEESGSKNYSSSIIQNATTTVKHVSPSMPPLVGTEQNGPISHNTAVLEESHQQVESSEKDYNDEAFVTLATNDLYGIGCLVLGHSLRLAGTKRRLVVVVTGGVTLSLRKLLDSIFDVIFEINENELALLSDPNMGVSFPKIYLWKLTQFKKCIFLECDTFVVQNCDELFEKPELSAVPDIAWPDCFNCSVFVYNPSEITYKTLYQTAQLTGGCDGGEQGLLNSFFRDSWKGNINCRLPFKYNLMANVSYTYAPAFEQFGKNAKIVHFLGTYKPWNVQWSPISGKMAPMSLSNIHKSYYPYIHSWLTLFIHYVIPTLSMELQEMIKGYYAISVHDLMKMYQKPGDEFLDDIPRNPSMRYRHNENNGHRVTYLSSSPPSSLRHDKDVDAITEKINLAIDLSTLNDGSHNSGDEATNMIYEEEKNSEELQEKDDVAETKELERAKPQLPTYNRMHMWEKGEMDYKGNDSSSNILKKIDALIAK